MSDTRTIYLKNNSGTIYSSDPSNVGYEYLNISDFDSVNPSENSIFTSATDTSLMYSSYDVKLVLTFISDYDNARQARADWVATNQNSITQISVANTNNPDLIFSKQAKVKTVDFIENHYVNGVQAELTLELAGRWQSSIQRTSATVYPYTGGTKKYNYYYSTADSYLLTDRNRVKNSSGKNASDSSRPYINDVTNTGAYNTKGNIYIPDGLFLQINDPKSEMYYSLVNAWTPLSQLPMLEAGETYTIGVDIVGSFDYVAFRISDVWYDPQPINHTKIERVYQQFTIPSDATQFYLRINASTNVAGETNFLDNQAMIISNISLRKSSIDWVPAPEDTNPKPTYKYGYQVITDEVITSGYNGFIINIPSQTTPVNVTLTAPSSLSVTLTTSQTNVPLQISSDMIGYSLDNFDMFTLLNKGFPASKYWDNLLSVYSTIQTILGFDTVTVSVASSTGSTIPFEFYLYKLQDLI